MTQNEEIVTARDCWRTQTEFQMNSSRQELAIEKRGCGKLFLAFLKVFLAPFQLRIDRSEFNDS
jgi:hypothetical protein